VQGCCVSAGRAEVYPVMQHLLSPVLMASSALREAAGAGASPCCMPGVSRDVVSLSPALSVFHTREACRGRAASPSQRASCVPCAACIHAAAASHTPPLLWLDQTTAQEQWMGLRRGVEARSVASRP
jgi:hypothetical protein